MPSSRGRAFRGATIALVCVSWLSGALFAAYILAFYLGAVPSGALLRWNRTLPIYAPHHGGSMIAIAAHFLTGAILLLLGPVQLIAGIRTRRPAVHRWIGRLYVLAAGLAGLGGLGFMAGRGTVGGWVMTLACSGYGVLMVLAAVQTYRHAAARRLDLHRAWAIRLFALTIGSWLYRLEYGFWLPLTGGLGTTKGFAGPVDHLMDFFFYVPTLMVAELFVRARGMPSGSALRAATTAAMLLATALMLVGTWYFAVDYWLPGILASV
jgi:hypothetical protein